jgi:hypothetical protein
MRFRQPLVAAFDRVRGALGPAGYCVIAVLLACFSAGTALAVEPAQVEGVAAWAQHPALGHFGVSGMTLPATLYLVRTRGVLPEIDGIAVHGAQDGVYLVSGDAKTVWGLAQYGCAVFPLQGAPEPVASIDRTWNWIDSPDPSISSMVARVAWEDVVRQVEWLVRFNTRFCRAPNHYEVACSVRDTLSSYGFEAELLPFQLPVNTKWNVGAIQPGLVYPDSFVIICGHFDSYADGRPKQSAPGADDNATGTVAVLTAARILSRYNFERSIVYLCFSAEELGLIGSSAYARWARENDMGIVAALNFDMLGYWKPGVPRDLEIEVNEASEWLGQAIVNAAELYTGAPYKLHVFNGAWWGDHASFWYQGYAAANHEEAWDWGDPDFNPRYHTVGDQPRLLSPDFTVDNIRIGVAALATLARPIPAKVAFEMRPGSCRDPFNPKSRGVSTALVLGSKDVDVRDIDVEALRLEGSVRPLAARVTDMGGPGDNNDPPCAVMSPDGYSDLRLTFSSGDIAEAIGPVAKGDSVLLHLTGCLKDGTGIRGDDAVVIVGEQGEGPEAAQSFDVPPTNAGGAPGEPPLPETFALYQNVPNPFNPSTRIEFDVPFAGANVTLRIYDVSGRLVRSLVDSEQTAGRRSVLWDGLNGTGEPVATGIYLCRLSGPGFRQTRKMVMLK